MKAGCDPALSICNYGDNLQTYANSDEAAETLQTLILRHLKINVGVQCGREMHASLTVGTLW